MSIAEHLDTSPAPEPVDAWFASRIAATAATGAPEARTALVERHAPHGGVLAPLHAHDEDETFRVLAGELTFFVGAEVVTARAGELVVAPAGVPRTYRVESDGARWLVLTRVASIGRFEDFGRALAAPPAGGRTSWPSDEELRSLTAIAAANRIHVLGPPGMLPQDL